MALERCINGLYSRLTVVLGAQWGDQGKSKLVTMLSGRYDISARFNGGDNNGHSVIKDGYRYQFHLVPSGILSPYTQNFLGNGMVINLQSLFDELGQLDKNKICYNGRILVSDRAHLVTKYQINESVGNEEKQGLGAICKGIGPTYASKVQRFGLRVGDLRHWETFQKKYHHLASFYDVKEKTYERPQRLDNSLRYRQLENIKVYRDLLIKNNMIVESIGWLNKNIKEGKRVLVEGSNGSMLDLDLGTYPYVTSSPTCIGAVCTGLGLSLNKFETIIGVAKAYTTRTGAGPFPTEQKNQHGDYLRDKGAEFGTITRRPRRCGWLDLPLLNYTNMINGYTSIALTKLNVLDELDQIKVAVAYKLNGQNIDYIPGSAEDLAKVEVVYENLKGWKQNTSEVKRPEDLPKEAINYIRFIEKHVGVPVSWVGVGSSHADMIKMIE